MCRKSEKHVGRSQIVDGFRDHFQLWEMHCRKATVTRESLIDYNVCRLASSLVLNSSLFWDTTQVWAWKRTEFFVDWLHYNRIIAYCVSHCVSLFIDHDVHWRQTLFRCEVVPGALVGTYVGVILNSILPGWAWLLDSDWSCHVETDSDFCWFW